MCSIPPSTNGTAVSPKPTRKFSDAVSSHISDLNPSKIKITLSKNPRAVPASDSAEAKSHKVCTDHMIVVSWTSKQGWADPELIQYGPLSLMPTASVLHYATECFEGMKLYRGYDNRLRLFRPQYNCERMLASAQRISLPSFDPKALLKLVRKLCQVDGPKWLPKNNPGAFLYIRPTMIASDPSLGFQVPKEALLYIIISFWPLSQHPTGSILETVPKPLPQVGIRLLASREDAVRAWPGGTGFAKIGANYGPTLLAHSEAKRTGYDQVLWLFGPDCQVTEAGSSNFFVIWRTDQGLQLLTAPLDERTILAGVTRQSILDLSRERFSSTQERIWALDDTAPRRVEALEVLERTFTAFDLVSAANEGRLLAAFVVGTASFVTSVSQINFKRRQIDIDLGAVAHVSLLQRWMSDILYGKEPSTWVDIVDEE